MVKILEPLFCSLLYVTFCVLQSIFMRVFFFSAVQLECDREGAGSGPEVRRTIYDSEREGGRAGGPERTGRRNADTTHHLAEGRHTIGFWSGHAYHHRRYVKVKSSYRYKAYIGASKNMCYFAVELSD